MCQDEVTINLRALTEKEVAAIARILENSDSVIDDEINIEAIIKLNDYDDSIN